MSTDTTTPFSDATGDIERKRRIGRAFVAICFASTLVGIVALVALIADVLYESWGWVTWEFLTYPPSQSVDYFLNGTRGAGMYPAIVGSIFLIALTAVFTIFLGVGAAVYLEEYAPRTDSSRLSKPTSRTSRVCRRSSTACSGWRSSSGRCNSARASSLVHSP